ncbi:hypothetical protein NBE98_14025 [Clostridium swellfunianum]|uniref:hypothetical protein n=1 Tax=Clostridium swellfunianum TaxID=1367462 RepID=UPI00202E4CD1|nr:hypothetical protein [Clostridium swellfunianum]MCM0649480.1 hypothetical protein [Clostridium swellfunianum]
MKRNKRLIYLLVLILFSSFFYGCDRIDQMKVKLGMKNNDFEYIKQGKIRKIVIQNTRDTGFRFVVTDQKAISELYEILSTAKPAPVKSELEPDYIFEMEEGPGKIYRFNYIAGLDKKDAGNLYSEDKIYLVSERIDNDIIKSFWNIRKPKDFQKIYYGNILSFAEKYSKEEAKGKSIGINIYDDVEVAKFIFSADLEDFKSSLSGKGLNTELMTQAKGEEKQKEYDVVMNVKTVGYKTFLYKCEITFWDKENKSEKKYYITMTYKSSDGRWTTKVDTQKPTGW